MACTYHDNQLAFRRGRGTHTARAIIYKNIAKPQEHHNQSTIVLRDVSKAFNKVGHEGLQHRILQ